MMATDRRGILLASFLLLFCWKAQAQLEKGSWMLGGTGTIHTIINHDSEVWVISLKPNGGYFLQDRLALGLSLETGVESYDDVTFLSLGASPFFRYYFLKTSPFNIFTEIKPGIVADFNLKRNNINRDFLFRGGFGVVYFITRTVGLEGLLNYSYQGGINFNHRIGFDLGLQIYLPSASE